MGNTVYASRGRLISASPTVREFGECVFAVFTPEGDSIAFSRGILLHMASMGAAIKWMLKNDYEEDPGIHEGDIFCNNDPQIGGAHSADEAVILPMFYKGELVAWVSGLTHIMEVGGCEPGATPPSALSRYDDGLMVTAQRVGENDKFFRDHHIMVSRNTRDPKWWILDDLAKLSGCLKMRDALISLIEEFGLDYYMKATYEMIEEGRRFAVRKIASVLFPGTYRAVGFYDVLNSEQPIRIQKDQYIHLPLEMTVKKAGELVLSFEGVSSPGWHANNSSLICTIGMLVYTLIQDVVYDGFFNSGIVQALNIHVPEDSILNPAIYYACSNWVTAIIAAGSCFSRALARAYYAKGFREEGFSSRAITCLFKTGGVDADGRQFAVNNFEMNCSGQPASSNLDGLDAAQAAWNPEVNLADVEQFEPIWPLRWLGRGVQVDGGGFGKHRGGAPICSLYVIEAPTKFVESGCEMSGDRVFCSSGIMGGYPAPARYRHTLINTSFREAVEQRLPLPHGEGAEPANPDFARLLKGELRRTSGASASVPFHRYDILFQATGGAGGWGDPLERDPSWVLPDVAMGLATPKSVRNVYDVALTQSNGTWLIDERETALLRKEMLEQRKARAVPTADYLESERKKIVEGKLAPIVKEMYNDCFNRYAKFLAEFKEFWGLSKEEWSKQEYRG